MIIGREDGIIWKEGAQSAVVGSSESEAEPHYIHTRLQIRRVLTWQSVRGWSTPLLKAQGKAEIMLQRMR